MGDGSFRQFRPLCAVEGCSSGLSLASHQTQQLTGPTAFLGFTFWASPMPATVQRDRMPKRSSSADRCVIVLTKRNGTDIFHIRLSSSEITGSHAAASFRYPLASVTYKSNPSSKRSSNRTSNEECFKDASTMFMRTFISSSLHVLGSFILAKYLFDCARKRISLSLPPQRIG